VGEGLTASGVNLSVAGCRSRSEGIIKLGALLQVLIDVPRYQIPLQVSLAMVRWSNGQEFGMDFLASSPDDQQRLYDLIQSTKAADAVRNDKKD
jgi:hypothetical protein